MRKEMQAGKGWLRALGLILVLLLLPTLYLTWDRWYGAHVVRSLCKKDGGERIFETANVRGFLINDHRYFCSACIRLLADRKFEYVDAHVTELGKVTGYFRYSLSNRSDDNCEDWSHPPEADRLLRQLGVKGTECVVVTTLTDRPIEPVLSQQWKTLSFQGVKVRLNQWTLIDERSERLLAQVNDYQFTSKLAALFDMSGHGGNADARCMKGNAYVNSVTTLASRVLTGNGRPATNLEKK